MLSCVHLDLDEKPSPRRLKPSQAIPMKEMLVVSLSVLVFLGCKKESPTGPINDSLSQLAQVIGGTFQMGSTTGSSYETPVHSVTLSSFRIDVTEVTYENWTDVRNWGLKNGYTDLSAGQNGYNPSGTNNPVTMVSWYDVVKWCNARSEKYGLTPVYHTNSTHSAVYRTGQIDLAADAVEWAANGYRLPTEAEWEFAARGGMKSSGCKYGGSNTPDSVEWYVGNSGNNTHPVSTKSANELGIYDMNGNVWECCWDWFANYSASAQTDPKGPASGTFRVMRGGSCWSGWMNSTVTFRPNYGTLLGDVELGFRCVRD
jgi:sulfatase modifying factor 1